MLATFAMALTLSALAPTGAAAPSFAGIDQAGRQVSLAALRGHPVVLYFYPMDRTPG